MKVIDASGLILGRMASQAAKLALTGNQVAVVNCEKAVISGSKKKILERYATKRAIGWPTHGPFYPRLPDRFVKRTIRGMLPWSQAKGREAFKRVKCYIGVPEEFKDKEITFENASVERLEVATNVSIGELSRLLGVKKNE